MIKLLRSVRENLQRSQRAGGGEAEMRCIREAVAELAEVVEGLSAKVTEVDAQAHRRRHE